MKAASRALLNFAAENTSRADENSADIAANLGADVLQVGVPAPLGFVVGVADVVADRRMLLAVCAMSHWISDSNFILEQPARLARAKPLWKRPALSTCLALFSIFVSSRTTPRLLASP